MASLMRSIVLLLLPAAAMAADAAAPADVVQRFVAAFNGRDLPEMLALAHPDIEWLSVSGSDAATETRGRKELEASLSSYFESCPSCRSTVAIGATTGPYVAAVEIARWETESGTRSQSSLSVYEIVEGRVRRVWYYLAVAP